MLSHPKNHVVILTDPASKTSINTLLHETEALLNPKNSGTWISIYRRITKIVSCTRIITFLHPAIPLDPALPLDPDDPVNPELPLDPDDHSALVSPLDPDDPLVPVSPA
jgi:hypothetical protein